VVATVFVTDVSIMTPTADRVPTAWFPEGLDREGRKWVAIACLGSFVVELFPLNVGAAGAAVFRWAC
jgi:hypothetical protein